MIPAFAVERTQELLADLLQVMAEGQAPAADVFLDSPLAIEATDVFLRRGYSAVAGRNPFEALHAGERLRFLRTPRESDTLDRVRGWYVVMAASGMCDAGRIRKHLKRNLWRAGATVLLSGFQVQGTLGRLLADGVQRVRIQGDDVRVAARIRSLDIYSGHADAGGLVRWAAARTPIAGKLFICHGEPRASEGLAKRLSAAGVARENVIRPVIDQVFSLGEGTAEPAPQGKPRLASEAPSRLDWHNARAALLGDLDARLDAAPNDAAREALLEQARRAIGGG